MTRAQRRQKQYANLCQRCQQGYDPSRSALDAGPFKGTVLWLHDYVIPCKAAALRERHYQEQLAKAAAVSPPQ